MMVDFFNRELRDPFQFVDAFGSLLALRNKIYFSEQQPLNQIGLLNALAKFVFNGKRAEESFIIKLICSQTGPVSYETVQELVSKELGYCPSIETLNRAIHSLNLMFSTRLADGNQKPIAEIFNYKVIQLDNGKITSGVSLSKLIENQLSKTYLVDAAEFSLLKFKADFDLDKFCNGFKRESIYCREDIFRILGWNRNPTALNVGGYQVSSDGTNCPLFITYQKNESISTTTNYKDQFLDAKTLICMSKNKRTINSPDVLAIASQSSNLMRIPIFVKKEKEDLNFYYVGDGTSLSNKFELTRMNPSDARSPTVVKMLFELDNPVSPNLLKYLTSQSF